MTYKTEQEAFWAGDFGDAYIERNQGEHRMASRVAQFAKILSRAQGVRSVIELGANIGTNLQAIRRLLPDADLAGIEINQKAYAALQRINGVTAWHGSLLDGAPRAADIAFTSGVLIHLNPDVLPLAYQRLYEASNRYVLVTEYYNPTPVEVPYRGHSGRLFKRDFAGELMDAYPLKLVDYGFVYHRDPVFPGDDLTWFLMEKA